MTSKLRIFSTKISFVQEVYIVTYNMKWVKTTWTHSMILSEFLHYIELNYRANKYIIIIYLKQRKKSKLRIFRIKIFYKSCDFLHIKYIKLNKCTTYNIM